MANEIRRLTQQKTLESGSMDDKQRTRVLALGLAAVVGVYALRSTVDSMVMKPIRDLQAKLFDAQSENESLSLQKIQLTVAQKNLSKWRAISLPPDIDDAQRLYREWVYELTRQCGFSGPGFEVATGTRSAQKEHSTVNVEVKNAETDLQGLTKFLYLFDHANLLHRISGMKIDSPGAQGNPKLSVSLTAEGMSVSGSEDRSELLPRTTLTGNLSDAASEMIVAPNESFPTWEPFEPFLVRIDRELLKVEAVSDNGWKVQRGAVGTKPAAHEEKAIVELLPVAWDRKETTLEQYAAFVGASVFVIPSPPKTWNPRLAGVSDKLIQPGEEVKFTAKAESLDPELGEPRFTLAEAAEGMTLDSKTGEFLWKPAQDLVPGKYSATVVLTQVNNPDIKLDSKLTITIRVPNTAPQLVLPESAIVIIGREFLMKAAATDEDPMGSLKFSVGSGTPEGLTIDAATGQLKWTPARTFTPGDYEVEVIVTDSGDDPKTTSGRISLDVQDDNAALTLLSGAVSKDDVWFAWFRNKGTGKTNQLKTGDKLNVSEISAEIVSITSRFVTLRDAEGLWKLALGDGLRDRKLIEPAPKPEAPKESVSDYDADPDVAPANPATPADPEKPTSPQPKTDTRPEDKPAESDKAAPSAEAPPVEPAAPAPVDGSEKDTAAG